MSLPVVIKKSAAFQVTFDYFFLIHAYLYLIVDEDFPVLPDWFVTK